VATGDGARPVEALPHVNVSVGQLDAVQMAALLEQYKPTLVIDATHPYAKEASKNIAEACGQTGTKLVRIRRESMKEQGCVFFDGIDDLLVWLEHEPGVIFAATGASSAKAFTKLPDYQTRVWMRVLPSMDSLRTCLDLGYRLERLICMQGPFSEEINIAMFRNANAKILITKDSGVQGGFHEKVQAAQSLGMVTAVLSKPEETGGISMDEARGIITELSI